MRHLVMAALVAIGSNQAQAQEVARGEEVFRKCASCHQVGEGATNKVGPVLTGVIGRIAGSYDGYRYSAAMTAAAEKGLVWDAAALVDYLADPKIFLRTYLGDRTARAKMPFRLKNEEDRRDVVAYLATFQAARAVQTCVANGSEEPLLFAVEAPDGTRETARLIPGASLCATGGQVGGRAVVSAFDAEGKLEGCSWLIRGGETETLIRFSEADRCTWSRQLE